MVLEQKISKRAMNFAIASACAGAFSQTMIRDSSIFILYVNLFGGDSFLSLLTTALPLLCTGLLMIPIAHLMESTGKKRLMIPSLGIGMVGMLLIVFAGFFPVKAKWIITLGLSIYSITLAFYIAGWFPLLREIVPAGERGSFFGRLRISWQFLLTIFLFTTSRVVGDKATLLTLQIIIGIGAVLIMARIYFLHRIPEKALHRNGIPFIESIKIVFKTKGIIRFGFYLFFIYFFSFATIPIVFLFVKIELEAPDNYIVLLSLYVNVGSIIGFFLGGKLSGKYSTKGLMLFANIAFIVLNLLFLLIGSFNLINSILIAGILILYSGFTAFTTIESSSKIFALANPLVINLSMAVCISFDYFGKGLSRIISGIILDTNLFPKDFYLFGIEMTSYHFMFMAYGFFLLSGIFMIKLLPQE